MRNFVTLLRRFRDDERGVFAVFFGLFAVVLIAMAGAVVDFTNLELSRTRAQQALDAAALGLAPKIYDTGETEETMVADAQGIVAERVGDSNITIDVTAAEIDKPNGRLRLSGSIVVPMSFVQLVGIRTMTAGIMAEATKGSINLEVSVALDNTGSMKNYIADLKTGLNGLIDIVVSDTQDPTYSKMAIVPYSAAVDAGIYADTARGAIPAPKKITNLSWWDSNTIKLSGVTQKKPPVVTTTTQHGFATGDRIWITGVSGMTSLNDKFYTITKISNTTFSLQTTGGNNVDATNYSKWTKNGTIYHCAVVSTCEAVATSDGHGFTTGQLIRFFNINKSPYNALNATADDYDDSDSTNYAITKIDNDHFKINGITNSNIAAATAGDAYCTTYGCKYYNFSNSNKKYTYEATASCVTERAGTNAYTDAAPTVTKLAIQYTKTGSCDLNEPIVPLTADKDILYAASNKMDDHGSTAGHLGTAWGWYMVAPDFGYVWNDPEAVPADYDADNLLKVVILMTDGAYNIQYLTGVDDAYITGTAVDATTQARALCTKMKEDDKVVVYTVGFNISEGSSEAQTMTDCASDAGKAFLPADGDELIEDFRSIGQNITDLRLSR